MGSFNRKEVIGYMVINHCFRYQGAVEDATQTVLDIGDKGGHNCLTYLETIDDISTRSKIYNKIVRMLECKAVHATIGCHWKDWVSQEYTRLAGAINKASHRGLTRMKVTFYYQR